MIQKSVSLTYEPSAVERRRNTFKGLKEFHLKAKAETWPWLSYMCHIRSTAEQQRLVLYCRTTSVSAAHAAHCATHFTPCWPTIRDFFGWIRTPPPNGRRTRRSRARYRAREGCAATGSTPSRTSQFLLRDSSPNSSYATQFSSILLDGSIPME